jgi:hypothetical protein
VAAPQVTRNFLKPYFMNDPFFALFFYISASFSGMEGKEEACNEKKKRFFCSLYLGGSCMMMRTASVC